MGDLQTRGSVRIYGCGGAGVNITSFFNEAGIENNCAEIYPAYIDASRSNLRSDFSEENIFILENVDGSGKVRRENHEEIANVTRQILLQIPPKDFNIVIFSASGGTGSVSGPLLVAELLERKLPVVALVIGSDESIITATNTLNTLKTLEKVSRTKKLPVVMYYEHNDRDRKQGDIDRQLHLVVSTLSVLTSRLNHGMDTRDVINWVQFSHTTSVDPQLALFEVFKDDELVEAVSDPISVASVYKDRDVPMTRLAPEYHSDGYCSQPSEYFEQLHFVITIDRIPKIVGNVKKTLEDYENHRSSRVKHSSILDDNDSQDDNVLVL